MKLIEKKQSTSNQQHQAGPPVSKKRDSRSGNIFSNLRQRFHRESKTKGLYSTLNENEIRLIQLDPSTGTSTEGFVLKHFSLKSCPKFYALSYCWGSYNRTENITCNGQRFQVTPHLYRGIAELCAHPQLCTWFWIDQICVNQEDIKERSHQVKLMQSIYTRALRTVVWPGLDSAPFDQGLALADQIFEMGAGDHMSIPFPDPKAELGSWRPRWPVGDRYIIEEDIVKLGLPGADSDSWRQLVDIFDSPWFTRLWVLQEVVLSSDSPLILINDYLGDIQPILWAGIWMGMNGGELHHWKFASLKTSRLIVRLAMTSEPWDYASLLTQTRLSNATDVKDRLFALLSLARETRGGTSIPTPMAPEYTKSYAEVSRDFTRHIISASGSLFILCFINLQTEELHKLESEDRSGWLSRPFWAYRPSGKTTEDIVVSHHVFKRTGGLGRTDARFAATKKTLARLSYDTNPWILVLEGVRVDTVAWAAVGKSDGSVDPDPLRQCKLIFEWLIASGAEISLPSLLRNLLLAANCDTRALEFKPVDIYHHMLESEGDEDLELREFYLSHLEASCKDEQKSMDKRRVDRMRNDFAFNPHRFFATTYGWIGVGPNSTEAGDTICVLFGGTAPFVIRPNIRNRHVILGECNIPGWMTGLAMDQLESGTLQPEVFKFD